MANDFFEIKGSGVLFYESDVVGIMQMISGNSGLKISLTMQRGVEIHFLTTTDDDEWQKFLERFRQRPGEQ